MIQKCGQTNLYLAEVAMHFRESGLEFSILLPKVKNTFTFSDFKMKAVLICLLLVGTVMGGDAEKKRRCRQVTNDFNRCTQK